MHRVLISGPPASGKSTLARALVEEIGGVIIDYDAIAHELGSDSHHDHSRAVGAQAHVEVARRIRETRGPAVLIRTAPRRAEREAAAKQFGADTVIVLAVPAAEAKKRAARDARPDWTGAAIDRWWSRYEPSPLDSPHELTGPATGPGYIPEREHQMTEVAEAQATETETGEQDTPKPKPTETVEFWKQKAREQESRAKANATAAEKLQQFEDRDKTEAQRLTERAETAERLVAETEARALRLEVAAEKGLSPTQAKRLVGSTREELEADAAELLETFKPPADEHISAATASLDLGNHGTPAAKGSPEADFAKFIGGQLGRHT